MFRANGFDGMGCVDKEFLDECFAHTVHGVNEEAVRDFGESWEMHEGAEPVEVRLKDGEIEDERARGQGLIA